MGRSRGGLTTKIHALVDANGLPIALKLTEGQAHDGRSAAGMIDNLGKGQILLADRAYDSDALRREVAGRGGWANIKPMPGRINIPAFSPFLYRFRNLVERFFNKLKHFRAVATRFEKHDANYLALVKIAAARIWMRFYEFGDLVQRRVGEKLCAIDEKVRSRRLIAPSRARLCPSGLLTFTHVAYQLFVNTSKLGLPPS